MNIVKKHMPVEKFYRRGKNKVQFIVMHWIASNRTDASLLKYLSGAPHFYDYVVGRDGTVYELNPNTHKYASKNVRGQNLHSVGIVYNIPGFPVKGVGQPKWDTATETIHGKMVKYNIPTDVMVESSSELVLDLVDKHLLREPSVCLEDRMLPRTPTNYLITDYNVLGHYHFQLNRTDPGPETMYRLSKALRNKINNALETGSSETGLVSSDNPDSLEWTEKDNALVLAGGHALVSDEPWWKELLYWLRDLLKKSW